MADYSQEIARLEALLNSATTDVSTDGLRTAFDLNSARKRLNELKGLQDPTASTNRPRLVGINLRGAW